MAQVIMTREQIVTIEKLSETFDQIDDRVNYPLRVPGIEHRVWRLVQDPEGDGSIDLCETKSELGIRIGVNGDIRPIPDASRRYP